MNPSQSNTPKQSDRQDAYNGDSFEDDDAPDRRNEFRIPPDDSDPDDGDESNSSYPWNEPSSKPGLPPRARGSIKTQKAMKQDSRPTGGATLWNALPDWIRRRPLWFVFAPAAVVVGLTCSLFFDGPGNNYSEEIEYSEPSGENAGIAGKTHAEAILDSNAPTIRLRSEYHDFAINEARGEFMAVERDGRTVHWYSEESLKQSEPIPTVIATPSICRAIAFKPTESGGFFCILCDGNILQLVDSERKLQTKSIELVAGIDARLLCSKNPSDPWIFVVSRPTDTQLTAVHVVTHEIVEQSISTPGFQSETISPSGRYVILGDHALDRQDPSGGLQNAVWRKLDSSFSTDSQAVFFAHNEQLLYKRGNIFDMQSGAECHLTMKGDAQPPLPSLCGFAELPILVGIVSASDDERAVSDNVNDVFLGTTSSNTLARFDRVIRLAFDAPADAASMPRHPGPRSPSVRLIPDDRNRRIYCIQGPQLKVVDANILAGADDRLVKIPEMNTATVGPGGIVRFSLKSENGLKLKLQSPLPEGASVANDIVEWTPTQDQIGTTIFSVEYETEKSIRSISAKVIVEFPQLSVPAPYTQLYRSAIPGSVYGVDQGTGTIYRFEFTSDAAPVRCRCAAEIKLLDSIDEVIEKPVGDKTLLCVLSIGSKPRLLILNAADLKLVAESPLEDRDVRMRSSANPQDPAVFVSDFRGKVSAYRVDALGQPPEPVNVKNVQEVSPNGMFLLSQEGQVFLRSNAVSARQPQFIPTNLNLHMNDSHARTIFFDASSSMAASQRMLWPSLFGSGVATEIPQQTIFFLNDDCVLSSEFNGRNVTITRSVFGEQAELRAAGSISIPWNYSGQKPPAAFVDMPSQRLVVFMEQRVAVRPLSLLGITPETPLVADFEKGGVFLATKESTDLLQPGSPEDMIELKQLPAGMTSNGNQVSWKPDRNQVGNHLLHYVVKRGERSVSRAAVVSVVYSQSEAQQILAGMGTKEAAENKVEVPEVAAPKVANEALKDLEIQSLAVSQAGTTAVLSKQTRELFLFRTATLDSGPFLNSIARSQLSWPGIDIQARKLRDRNVFLALCGEDGNGSEIVVLDAQSLEVIKTVPLTPCDGHGIVVSEDATDPWAFFTGQVVKPFNVRRDLRAVNLETGEVCVDVFQDTARIHEVDYAAISPDGRSLVATNQRNTGDLRWFLRLGGDFSSAPRFKSSEGDFEQDGSVFAFHPAGTSVFYGRSSFDFRFARGKSVDTNSLISPVYLRKKPFLIGLVLEKSGEFSGVQSPGLALCAFDANSLERVGATLRILNLNSETQHERELGKALRILLDEQSGGILCVNRNDIIRVSIDELQLPPTADLTARLKTPPRIEMNVPCELEIILPESKPPVTIVDSQLKPGMELKENKILWTPSFVQGGLSEIAVTVSDGVNSHESAWLVHVEKRESTIEYHDTFAALSSVNGNPGTNDGSLITASSDGRKLLRYDIENNALSSPPALAIELDSEIRLLQTRPFEDRHLVLLGTTAEKVIRILDATTFESMGSIPIDGAFLSTVHTSQNPKDPFIYFQRGGRIEAASLKSMSTTGPMFLEAERFFIGPSGVLGYAEIRGTNETLEVVPAIMTSNLNSPKPQFTLATSPTSFRTRTVETLLADHYGVVTIVDGKLMDAAQLGLPLLRPELIGVSGAARDGFAAGFLDGGRIVLSLLRTEKSAQNSRTPVKLIELVAEDSLTRELSGKVELSVEENPQPTHLPPRWTVLSAPWANHVVCLSLKEVVVVPKNQLLPDGAPAGSPVLRTVWVGPKFVHAAKESRWSLFGTPKSVSVEFPGLPDGAVETDGEIVWTPTVGQIGKHILRAKLTSGTATSFQNFEVSVGWPTLILPFSPTGIATEDIGPRVAAWQQSELLDGKIVTNNCGYLSVINTASDTPIFTGRLLKENPRGSIDDGVIAGDNFVFCNNVPEGSQLWKMPLEGAESAEPVQVPEDVKMSVNTMMVIGSHLVVDFTDRLVIYDVGTLELKKEIKPPEGMIPRPILAASSFGPTLFGTVVDDDLKPALALRPAWYSDEIVRPVSSSTESPNEGSKPKKREMRKGEMTISLIFDLDQQIRTPTENRSSVPEQVFGVGLQQRPLLEHWSRRLTGELRFETSEGIVLNRSLGNMDFRLYDEFLGFHYSPRATDVIVCAGRKLMQLPYPKPEELRSQDSKNAILIVPEHNVVLLSSNSNTTLQHKVFGKPAKTEPASDIFTMAGVKFSQSTLAVEINGSAFAAALVERRAQALLKAEKDKSGSREERVTAILSKAMEDQKVQAREVLGYQGKDFLEAVPIAIRATHADNVQQNTAISYIVYIELKNLRTTLLRLIK